MGSSRKKVKSTLIAVPWLRRKLNKLFSENEKTVVTPFKNSSYLQLWKEALWEALGEIRQI